MPRGRLLVLDDDATVGQILVMGAQSVGFEARFCDGADEFFAAVADWLPTHLAIDLAMPLVGGTEVMRRLAASGCRARVIISSGAGPGELDAALREARALGLDAAGVLPKPFSLAGLRALIADAPGAEAPPAA
jgi:FixJ family two-component response regulator